MSVDYKIIGKRIKERRKACSVTQEILAEKLNVSVGYISQIERGITRVNLDTLSNIADELGCDLTMLLANVSCRGESFLNNEIMSIFLSLDAKHRRMLVDIAEIIKRN